MTLGLLGDRPSRDTKVLRTSAEKLVSTLDARVTEFSVEKFLTEYFTPITTSEEHH